MGRVELERLNTTVPFRKVAMGTWRSAKDPTVYGLLEIDMTKVNKFKEKLLKEKGIKVSPTHLVGKAAAYCLKRRPEINGMIRGSRIYLRKNVSLFYQVNTPGKSGDKVKGANLTGCVIHKAEEKSLLEIVAELQTRAEAARTDKDPELKKSTDTIKILPWWFMGIYLNIASWLIYGLNLNLGFLGLPRDPFGSIMITNVGGLGIDVALAPLCPYTRVPILLTLGAIKDKPWVVDGKIEVRPIMSVAVTFDHRMVDGIHASKMSQDFKNCFDNPEKYFG